MRDYLLINSFKISFSINPKEPIDEEVVKLSMAQIIASDIFVSSTGKLVAAKGAKVIDRNVVEYELA
ncbi:DUF2922 domain-containing protein [Neobacillus sp. Marseille-QA0830]